LLLVFPDAQEAEAIRTAFHDAAPDSQIHTATDLATAAAILRSEPVSVVVGAAQVGDHRLTEVLTDDGSDFPVVVVVDEGDEQRAMAAQAAGALDWVARSDSLAEALPHIALGAAREWREFGLRRAAEEQLRHADRLALVGRVAAGVVHEVGTPLNVIRMRAQLLQMDPAGLEEAVSVIVEQSDRIAEMLQRTLVLARKRLGGPRPIDLLDVAVRAESLLAPTLRRSHVTAEVRGSPAPVLGDPGELLQVALNLLTNAMDAMGDGGSIHVIASGTETTATLSVRDTGEGVAPEHIPHLFAPFFTTKDPGRGTGLGLAVCAEIAARHGGRITVESVPGQGSTFKLELPRR